ncbi:hypothetical protein AALB53_02875 [Lachnospiraceae bacterium 47-T17]
MTTLQFRWCGTASQAACGVRETSRLKEKDEREYADAVLTVSASDRQLLYKQYNIE